MAKLPDVDAILGGGLARGGYDTIRLRKQWQQEYPEGEVAFDEWLKKNNVKLPNMPKSTGVSG